MKRQKHILTSTAEVWKNYKDTSVPWGSMTAQQWDETQKFLVEQKLLDKPVPVETLFTNELIDDVNKFEIDPVIKRAEAAR